MEIPLFIGWKTETGHHSIKKSDVLMVIVKSEISKA